MVVLVWLTVVAIRPQLYEVALAVLILVVLRVIAQLIVHASMAIQTAVKELTLQGNRALETLDSSHLTSPLPFLLVRGMVPQAAVVIRPMLQGELLLLRVLPRSSGESTTWSGYTDDKRFLRQPWHGSGVGLARFARLEPSRSRHVSGGSKHC